MPLTDTFVKNVKPTTDAGVKYADGDGMYLLVQKSGNYWRFDFQRAIRNGGSKIPAKSCIRVDDFTVCQASTGIY